MSLIQCRAAGTRDSGSCCCDSGTTTASHHHPFDHVRLRLSCRSAFILPPYCHYLSLHHQCLTIGNWWRAVVSQIFALALFLLAIVKFGVVHNLSPVRPEHPILGRDGFGFVLHFTHNNPNGHDSLTLLQRKISWRRKSAKQLSRWLMLSGLPCRRRSLFMESLMHLSALMHIYS